MALISQVNRAATPVSSHRLLLSYSHKLVERNKECVFNALLYMRYYDPLQIICRNIQLSSLKFSQIPDTWTYRIRRGHSTVQESEKRPFPHTPEPQGVRRLQRPWFPGAVLPQHCVDMAQYLRTLPSHSARLGQCLTPGAFFQFSYPLA